MIHKFQSDRLRVGRLVAIPLFIRRLTQKEDVVLGGGALRTVVDDKDEIQDYDIFFLSGEARDTLRAELDDMPAAKQIFKCPKGELYTYEVEQMGRALKVQLITKFIYADVYALLNTFDINACRGALYKGDVYLASDFIRDVRKKQVTIHEVNFPVATISRVMKYKSKGYTVRGTTLKDLTMIIASREWSEDELQLYVD